MSKFNLMLSSFIKIKPLCLLLSCLLPIFLLNCSTKSNNRAKPSNLKDSQKIKVKDYKVLRLGGIEKIDASKLKGQLVIEEKKFNDKTAPVLSLNTSSPFVEIVKFKGCLQKDCSNEDEFSLSEEKLVLDFPKGVIKIKYRLCVSKKIATGSPCGLEKTLPYLQKDIKYDKKNIALIQKEKELDDKLSMQISELRGLARRYNESSKLSLSEEKADDPNDSKKNIANLMENISRVPSERHKESIMSKRFGELGEKDSYALADGRDRHIIGQTLMALGYLTLWAPLWVNGFAFLAKHAFDMKVKYWSPSSKTVFKGFFYGSLMVLGGWILDVTSGYSLSEDETERKNVIEEIGKLEPEIKITRRELLKVRKELGLN